MEIKKTLKKILKVSDDSKDNDIFTAYQPKWLAYFGALMGLICFIIALKVLGII